MSLTLIYQLGGGGPFIPAAPQWFQGGGDQAVPWQWEAPPSYVILSLTQQKVFGQGGQVPTKQWHFDYDDAGVWQYQVERNQVLLSAAAPFFAPGRHLDYDDASYWLAHPLSSYIITNLTQQTVFGQGGQVPTKQWHYDYDDASYWLGEPEASAIITNLTQQKVFGQGGQVPTKQWHYDYDDASLWSWSAPGTFKLLGGKVPTKQWHYDYDASDYWVGEPEASAIITNLTQQTFYGQGGQAITKVWHWDWDTSDPWFWPPQVSQTLRLLTEGGKPVFNQWVPYLDDAGVWQWAYPPDTALLHQTNPPFFAPQRHLDYDDASYWQAQPLPSYAITLTTTQVKFFGQPGQAPTKQWHYDYDDSSVWYATPLSSEILRNLTQQGQPPTKSWRYDYDDASVWQWYPERNQSLLQPSTTPFFKQWVSSPDDQAVWNAEPLPVSNSLIRSPAGTPVTLQWFQTGGDDSSVWYATPLLAKTIYFPAPVVTTGSAQWLIRARRRAKRS